MKFLLYSFLFLLFSNQIYSFQNKLFLPTLNHNLRLFMSPEQMINYLTSFREYTIITVDNNYKNLEDIMIENKMNVYYVDLNNLLDKKDVLTYLKKEFNNYDSAEDLWIFNKGFFIGTYNDVINIINKKNYK